MHDRHVLLRPLRHKKTETTQYECHAHTRATALNQPGVRGPAADPLQYYVSRIA